MRTRVARAWFAWGYNRCCRVGICRFWGGAEAVLCAPAKVSCAAQNGVWPDAMQCGLWFMQDGSLTANARACGQAESQREHMRCSTVLNTCLCVVHRIVFFSAATHLHRTCAPAPALCRSRAEACPRVAAGAQLCPGGASPALGVAHGAAGYQHLVIMRREFAIRKLSHDVLAALLRAKEGRILSSSPAAAEQSRTRAAGRVLFRL